MKRFGRAFVAAILGAVLVSALPATCACAMHASPKSASGHGCCAPATGISAASDCCRTAPASTAEATPTVVTVAVTPGLVAEAPLSLAREVVRLGTPQPAPAHSPPPAILRL